MKYATNADLGMLRRVALVRTEVSGERIPSVFSVTRIGEFVACFRC
jgi:hypothetical protein